MSRVYPIQFAGLTDIGKKRDHNEDGYFINPDAGIALVADGMGGHQAGEVASRIIVETFKGYDPAEGLAPGDALKELVRTANATIYRQAQEAKEKHGMGSTLTSILFSNRGFHVLNVGDSRTYRLRQGDLRQITADHSFVQLQVQMGLLTQEDSRKSRLRHILTRSIGGHPEVEVDLYEDNVAGGDLFLLCSDGFHQGFSNDEIRDMLQNGSKELEKLAAELVASANERDGSDNITVVLARVG